MARILFPVRAGYPRQRVAAEGVFHLKVDGGVIWAIIAVLFTLSACGPTTPDEPTIVPAPPAEDLPGPLEEEELIRDEDRWIPLPEQLPQWQALPFDEPMAIVSPLQTFSFHQRTALRIERLGELYDELDEFYAGRSLRPELIDALEETTPLRAEADAEFEELLQLSTQMLMRGELFVGQLLRTQASRHATRLIDLHTDLQALQIEMAMYQFDALPLLANRHFQIARLHEEVVERFAIFLDDE